MGAQLQFKTCEGLCLKYFDLCLGWLSGCKGLNQNNPKPVMAEEYERFEITDYDLDNEFNPNRNRRRPTKKQQIYGES